MILTLKEIVELMTTSNVWFFGVGAAALVLMFVVKIVFKGIKWLVLLVIFGILIFLLYGSLFTKTYDSAPEELKDTQRAQENAVSAYQYLQTKVFSIGKNN